MIRHNIAAVLLALLGGCTTPSTFDESRVKAASERAKAAADLLFQRLSSELATAMANGGPGAAVHICRDRAPVIAAEIEATSGVDMERTALRVRSPANAPDDWEKTTMVSFVARREAGEEWAAMTATRIEGRQLRWMRPIALGSMCAACHGDTASIDSQTQQSLLTHYPADEAIGFAVGELRGAFSARVDIR